MKKVGKTPATKNGMIIPQGVYFYYVRDGRHPIACVAVSDLSDLGYGLYARGVSICSDKDQFSRRRARQLAYARLCKAVGQSSSSEPILGSEEDSRPALFLAMAPHIRFKAEYSAELSPWEKKLFE